MNKRELERSLIYANKMILDLCGRRFLYAKSELKDTQLIETPVAENLIVSSAIGLSIEGFKPVVYIERFDFVLNAMDTIVNHLDKIKNLSNGEFDPKVIIRTVIGNKYTPLFTGVTHVQNFIKTFQFSISIPVIQLPKNSQKIMDIYTKNQNCIIVEEKDLYEYDC